jgi:hypothetical protein
MSYAQTLILTQSYRPHEIVDWKEAVTRMVNGKIQVVVQYDEILASLDRQTLKSFPELRTSLRAVVGTDVERIDIKVPAVAVLLKAIKPVKTGKHIKFSKINVCLRDKFCCQYCGQKFKMSELQYEHVVPRAQGGKTSWTNIVMACSACNSFKAARTPEQAGMTLLSVPVKPRVLPMNEPVINTESAPEEWLPFLAA